MRAPERPAPTPIRHLGTDGRWADAPELGFFGRILDQDTATLGRVPAKGERFQHNGLAVEIHVENHAEKPVTTQNVAYGPEVVDHRQAHRQRGRRHAPRSTLPRSNGA